MYYKLASGIVTAMHEAHRYVPEVCIGVGIGHR